MDWVQKRISSYLALAATLRALLERDYNLWSLSSAAHCFLYLVLFELGLFESTFHTIYSFRWSSNRNYLIFIFKFLFWGIEETQLNKWGNRKQQQKQQQDKNSFLKAINSQNKYFLFIFLSKIFLAETKNLAKERNLDIGLKNKVRKNISSF